MKTFSSTKALLAVGLTAFFLGLTVQASSPFSNLTELQTQLGFSAYYQTHKQTKPIKIAILDTGFKDYEKALGLSLPKNAIYHVGPVAPIKGTEEVEHGRVMAEIAYLLMTDSGQNTRFAPSEFHLYNVSGFSNFKAAIDDVIKRGIDVVIYSEVWQLGGNWDGRGFVNSYVNRATAAGVLWINAAGNFGGRTFQTAIVSNANDNWVRLPNSNNSLHIRCQPPQKIETKKCFLRAALTWNDFKDDEQLGTDKDLDLVLMDDMGNILANSSLKQVLEPAAGRGGYSNYPRENITFEVDPGVYFLKIKDRSTNFGPSDRLRLVIDGDFLTVPSGQVQESMLNPADNPNVITVGASDSERSSVSVRLGKPDLSSPSQIIFAENQRDMRGSSNAAAIVGAGVAMLKTLIPNANRSEILAAINQGYIRLPNTNSPKNLSSLASTQLLFGPPQGNSCYPRLSPQQFNLAQWPNYFNQALSEGGVVVATNLGVKIMTPFDPIVFLQPYNRNREDDLVATAPGGYALRPRQAVYQLGQDLIEIFQNPSDYPACEDSQITNYPIRRAGSFSLPALR